MKKNEGKAGVILLIIVLILMMACAAAYGYLYVTKLENRIIVLEQEKNKQTATVETTEQKNETNVEDNNTSNTNVKTSDLVTLYYNINNANSMGLYAFIEDGELYYYKVFSEDTAEKMFFGSKQEMKKYPNLNNIKRLKRYNLGTGINPVPFLITEDGKVYQINFYSNTKEEINVEPYDEFKDYKVEDILSHEGEMYDIWEILLKDGTTKTITVKDENM